LETDLLSRRLPVVHSPDDVAAIFGFGVALADLGDPVSGADWLRRATAVAGHGPALAEGVAALALRCGNFALARRFLRRAIGSAPSHAVRHVALARAESHLDPRGTWRRLLSRAVAADPTSGEVRRVAAALERQSGRLVDALLAARTATILCPDMPDGLAEVARAEHGLGRAPIAATWLRRALAVSPARSDLANLAVLVDVYFADTRSVFEKVRRHASIVRLASRGNPAPLRDSDPRRRLRLGYVSADLHDHPVAHNLIGLVEHHDRDRFETVFLSGTLRSDDMTSRFAAVGACRSVLGLSDRRLAEVITGLEIDVLVNLAGRFAGNRPALAVQRAAPVQFAMHDLTSSGDAGTTATLLDLDLHPEKSTERFTEPVLRLPAFYLFSEPPSPEPRLRPPESGRPVVFGSANNPAKWSAFTLSLWARILARLPGSRLWLKFQDRTADSATRAALSRRLVDHGIPVERVDFGSGTIAKEAHLDALSSVDVALDPTPFGGATSTFEALWMGVPVVAMAGDRVAGRVSGALLKHVGLVDLIADDEEAYIDAAIRLALDGERQFRLRHTLRAALRRSPLLDRAAHAAAVEAAYRDAWIAVCEAHHRRQTSR